MKDIETAIYYVGGVLSIGIGGLGGIAIGVVSFLFAYFPGLRPGGLHD